MAKGDSNKVIQVLKKHGLRVTSQRRVVLNALLAVKKPMSHSQVVSDIGEQAPVYRNLVKLTRFYRNLVHQHPHFVCDDCGEVGILKIVSRADGIDRYALAHGKDDQHQHPPPPPPPFFVCDDCGDRWSLLSFFICFSTFSDRLATAYRPGDARSFFSCPSLLIFSVNIVLGASIQLRGECPDCLEQQFGIPRPPDRHMAIWSEGRRHFGLPSSFTRQPIIIVSWCSSGSSNGEA